MNEDAASATFKDVKAGDWHAGVIGAAAKAGLVQGFEGDVFKPEDTISREQMAVMITRALKVAGKSVDTTGMQEQLLQPFKDRAAISEWAKSAVTEAVQAKIVSGVTDDTFVPTEKASRAQAAVMLKRFLQYAGFIN